MRYGCCLNMIAHKPDKTGIEHLKELAALGYDYVELPLAEMTRLQETVFETLIVEELERCHIRCEVCNNFFPGDLPLTGKKLDIKRVMDYAERALGRAHRLGVEYVVFGSGKAKQVPPGFSIEQGYRQVAELLEMIGPVAKENGITIVIEPLRKEECNLINTFQEGCGLAAQVGQESVKVLVDFYHLTMEKEPVEHLVNLGKEYLRHVHFANPKGRVYPKCRNEADYEPFLQALKIIGYDRRISCEAYAEDFKREGEKALAFLSDKI